MKLSEIKKSMTVALMMNVSATSNKNSAKVDELTKDIQNQCEVVGEHLATKFLQECMKDAEKCLKDGKRFDELMKEFEKIGPRFSVEIEEEGK